MKETIIAKIRAWGNSFGIIITKDIAKKHRLKVGDIIKIVGDIHKFRIATVIEEDKMKSYKCKQCKHQFDSDDEYPYCSACDSNFLEEIIK
jgi:antitoxin component of MazEF toxin-antitoxin module